MQLPETFVQRARAFLGDEEYARLEEALDSEPPVSLRINSDKMRVVESVGTPVAWSRNAYYFPERLTYTFDPLLHAGCYYVQEASSMFLEQVLRQCVETPVRYLDLCAAPGGKSTIAVSALPKGSLIVSNEIVHHRAQVLVENLVKWGSPYGVVTHNAPADFSSLTHYFDVIQADVPCSGEGMFRKDPDSVSEWSADRVQLCASRQRTILSDIWPALRPGGILIYSTCTYNPEENERNVRFLMERTGAELIPIETDRAWNIGTGLEHTGPVYRFMPHRTQGEGLFMAVLRKPDEKAEDRDRLISSMSKRFMKQDPKMGQRGKMLGIPSELSSWIKSEDSFFLKAENDSIYAFPSYYERDIRLLNAMLTVLHKGVALAGWKGRDLVPNPELALSTILNRTDFQQVDVDWEDAVTYLRRESVHLSVKERGYLLLTYRDQPLGWVKNIGNRANNLYPQEWRIRSGYRPDPFRGLESVIRFEKNRQREK